MTDPAARPVARDTVVATLRTAGVVFAEDEAELLLEAATDDADVMERLLRRCAGEPLELVVGWAAFDGLRIPVVPGVFVPRRRSEALVEVADRETGAGTGPGGVGPAARPLLVLDLCCGTGALGVALARRLSARGIDVDLTLADADPAATRCAEDALAATATTGTVVSGDLFAAVPSRLQRQVDVLVANVPYVPTAEVALLPREARDHEPRTALDGGPDGLEVLRRVAGEAGEWLADEGTLICEVTSPQVPAALAAFTSAGLCAEAVADPARDTVVVLGSVAARCDR